MLCPNNLCSLWEEMIEFRKHCLNAEKEMLLAVRSLVDMAITKVEKSQPGQPTAQKVEIE